MDDRQGDTLLLLPLSLWERGLGGEGLGSGERSRFQLIADSCIC